MALRLLALALLVRVPPAARVDAARRTRGAAVRAASVASAAAEGRPASTAGSAFIRCRPGPGPGNDVAVAVTLEDQGPESPIHICFPGGASVLSLKQRLHAWGCTSVVPERQRIWRRAHPSAVDAEELFDGQAFSELWQFDGQYEPLWMTTKVRVMVRVFDSTDSMSKAFPVFDVDADTTTILALKEQVLYRVGSVDAGFSPSDIEVGSVHLFRDAGGFNSAELDDGQVFAHYGAGDNGYEEPLTCIIDQPLSVIDGRLVWTVDFGCGLGWWPLIPVYLENAEYPLDVCFKGGANVLSLKQELHRGGYTGALPEKQHILDADEEELPDKQSLSDLRKDLDWLYEDLRLTSKVRLAVTIEDSTGLESKAFMQFDVDAHTTTVLALKEKIVCQLDSVDADSSPREIEVGSVHLFRSGDIQDPEELDDGRVLAHYGTGDTGYLEFWKCVIDRPWSATETERERELS